MTLLAIVVCLFLERVWTSLGELRTFVWFEQVTDRIRGKDRQGLGASALGVVAVVGLPLVVLVMAQSLLDGVLGLLSYALAVAVLLYSLGPRDLDADVHRFLNAWEQGDEAKARDYAQQIRPAAAGPLDTDALGRSVVEGIVVAAQERWFGVVFWFVVLGPLGALWYRLACLLRDRCLTQSDEDGFKDAALMMHHILAWVPTRLTLMSYALVGSFAETIDAWRREASSWKDNWLVANERLLIQGGLGALQVEQELEEDETASVDARHVRAALGLVLRSLVLAVALIAVVTVGSWVA